MINCLLPDDHAVAGNDRDPGGGTPLFAELGATPVQFEGPVAVVEGTGVTHLRYRVKK